MTIKREICGAGKLFYHEQRQAVREDHDASLIGKVFEARVHGGFYGFPENRDRRVSE